MVKDDDLAAADALGFVNVDGDVSIEREFEGFFGKNLRTSFHGVTINVGPLTSVSVPSTISESGSVPTFASASAVVSRILGRQDISDPLVVSFLQAEQAVVVSLLSPQPEASNS